ncbi:MAG: hypothetical protein QOD51_2086, partial [Candidatus Eremiobacteraeota bacterium]|nr:hypothetical protein [Candidatus Eremiobacteraeota bacterium]
PSVIPAPSDAVLAPVFFAYTPGPHGERTYPGAVIQNLVVSRTGTYVTMAQQFGGAYSGLQEHSFKWTGSAWRDATPRANGIDAHNAWVAAATCPEPVFVADYLDNDAAATERERDRPHYEEDLVFTQSASARATVIGNGIATACADRSTAGYDAGFRPLGYQPGNPARTKAVVWRPQRKTVLGNGVAWSINRLGEAVGDDRPTMWGKGRPVLWNGRGFARTLSERAGSAFGINDSGSIVAEIGGEAVAFARNRATPPVYLNASVVQRGWRICGAYAIAQNGTILVVACKNEGLPRIATLTKILP